MKWIALILIMALTFYPVNELSRLIVTDGLINNYYRDTPAWWFWLELGIVWGFWLAIVPVYLVSMRYMERRWKRSNR